MRIFFLTLIIVYATVTSNEAKTNNKIDCKKLKCGKLENPVCVKLKSNDTKDKEVLIVAFNECEVLRARCLQGVKAYVVPMKICDHSITRYDYTIHKQRAKRDIIENFAEDDVSYISEDSNMEGVQNDNKNHGNQQPFEDIDDGNQEALEDHDNGKVEALEDHDNGNLEALDDHDNGNLEALDDHDNGKVEALEDHDNGNLEPLEDHDNGNLEALDDHDNGKVEALEDHDNGNLEPLEDHDNGNLEALEDHDNGKVEALEDHDNRNLEPLEDHDNGNLEALDDHDNGNLEALAEHDDEGGDDDDEEPDPDKIEEHQRDENINGKLSDYGERLNFYISVESKDVQERDKNNVGADYDIDDEEKVNITEYKANCPRECPAREMMICARCKHSIHRTFLSVCHLRMFNCQHPTEKLELVSRLPCMQSAPFLTGLPRAIAKISEPGDEDRVLKYFQCRDKHRLGRDDPRCQFRKDL